MIHYEYITIIVFLMGLIVFIVKKFEVERKEWMNRFMARDLNEYAGFKMTETRVRIPEKKEPDPTIEL